MNKYLIVTDYNFALLGSYWKGKVGGKKIFKKSKNRVLNKKGRNVEAEFFKNTENSSSNE